jgi:hypothetical protein
LTQHTVIQDSEPGPSIRNAAETWFECENFIISCEMIGCLGILMRIWWMNVWNKNEKFFFFVKNDMLIKMLLFIHCDTRCNKKRKNLIPSSYTICYCDYIEIRGYKFSWFAEKLHFHGYVNSRISIYSKSVYINKCWNN